MKLFIFAAALVATAVPAFAQDMPSYIVTMYRAAPGQQIELLKWLARQDEAARNAGVSASQLYVHQNGASWDYLTISPAPTAEQDRAIDAAATKLGLPTGWKAGLAMRRFIAEHSDTFAAGPTTAADMLKRAGQ